MSTLIKFKANPKSLLFSFVALFFSPDVSGQWRGDIVNNKYDGRFGYAEVTLVDYENSLNRPELRIELDLGSSPSLLVLFIKGSFFCDDEISVQIQVDMGSEVQKFNLVGVPFDGRDKLALGEYSTFNQANLYNALIQGKEGRITVYNSNCGSTKYHLNLNGSSAAINRLLEPYLKERNELRNSAKFSKDSLEEIKKQHVKKIEQKANQPLIIEAGDSITVEENVSLYTREGDNLVWVKLSGQKQKLTYTGNSIFIWGHHHYEVQFPNREFYVVKGSISTD